MGDVANIASLLLGQNNNSVHSLTSMLFGGGNTQQATATAQAQTSSAGKLNLGSLVSMALLASTLMKLAKKRQEANAQQQAQQQAAAAAAAAQQQAAAAAASPNTPNINLADGLDMGEIAALAGQFLGKPTATAAAQQQSQPVTLNMSQPQQTQAQGSGIDFATIAQIASTLLKR